MKKARKNIISIEPQLNAAKVESLADGTMRKALDAPAPKLKGWKLLHRLMEAYYHEPLVLNCEPISIERLKRGVEEIRAQFPEEKAIANSARAVLGDLQTMWQAADDIRVLPEVEAELPRVLTYAITAGFRYGVLVRRAGAIRGKGKSEHPAWPYIRAQWVKRKTSTKPNRNEVIFDGIADYEASIGAKIIWDYPTFLKPFNRQVIAKCRV